MVMILEFVVVLVNRTGQLVNAGIITRLPPVSVLKFFVRNNDVFPI